METGDWAVPFSGGFEFDKLDEFVPEEIRIRAKFSVRLVFKLTGIPNLNKVMAHMMSEDEKFNCKINANNDSHNSK